MIAFDVLSASSSASWARVTIDGVTGQVGLGFTVLGFRLTAAVRAADQSPAEQLDRLCADVRLGPKLLGRAVAHIGLPLRQYPNQSDQSLEMTVELDRARLEAIEEVRDGKDLQLSLDLYLLGSNHSGSGPWHMAATSYVINQSAWAQVLEQMQYRKTLLLEIPVPDERLAPELSAAACDLAKAQASLVRGDYREAVGQCRDVMEQLLLALKDDDRIGFDNSRDLTKADRLRLLRRSFRVFTHPARHRDEVSVFIDWNRVDARCAISIASALLNELDAPEAR